MKKFIISLDQGTTSSRAVIFDRGQNIVGQAQREFPQIYPKAGWVEHDPMDIYATQYAVMMEAITKSGVDARDIEAIGVANQRETTVVWDRKTGRPVHNAIVWQCRRTADICAALERDGLAAHIRESTGLIVDAYFSATKLKWILDTDPELRERAKKGDVLFGTVDTWLIWKLTNGETHATDYTNASRTMMYNIKRLDWDDRILSALGIPRAMLPEVRSSGGVYGHVHIEGSRIPIAAAVGDQQGALFGQACFAKGATKNTYGTGCFLLMNTGGAPYDSEHGLLATIAAVPDGGTVQYALEGSVFVGGAVIQWLRDEMRFIADSRDAEYYAKKTDGTGGVYIVPAFTGLGAPYWDMYARGCIVGITRGTTREHLIRAAQESIAYQSLDLIDAMERDTGLSLSEINVDGGASRDTFLMQFQSDILDKRLHRPANGETTALGAAYLAGLATGFWDSLESIAAGRGGGTEYSPAMAGGRREELLRGWHKAVGRSLGWDERG
ncbi:MAG: glycerol kinase GlpK [Clostridiales bacterium]|nr:glycerol kinase GlpK [Clostridiales bacterium]